MPLDTVATGSAERQVVVIGDSISGSNRQRVLPPADSSNLSGASASLSFSVGALLNKNGTYDQQRSAEGTTGIPAVSTEGTKPTYSCSVVGFTPAANATDFFQIVGSSTKVVRVLKVVVSGTASSAATVDVLLVKRTTANSGGTSTQPAIAGHDSNDPTATAVVNAYTANPSGLGTSAGNIGARKLNLGASGSAGTVEWEFTTRTDKGVVLRGTSQSLNLNWNGAAVPAGTNLAIEVQFTEE